MLLFLVFGGLFASSNAFNLTENGNKTISPQDTDAILSAMCDDAAHKFVKEYVKFMRTRVESPRLRNLTRQLSKSHRKDIATVDIDENLKEDDQVFVCTTCRATVKVITQMFREGGEFSGPGSRDLLKVTLLDFCNRFEIQSEKICEGLVEANMPIVNFIVERSEIDSNVFCGMFHSLSFCKATKKEFNLEIAIDVNGPEIKGPKTEIPDKGPNDITVVHISDIHYDPLYEVGSLAECDEILCCQRHKHVAVGTSKAAGYWGDYRVCDSPWHAIVDSLTHIKTNHKKIDYIYFTGDVVDHAIWLTSREKNTNVLKKVFEYMKETFGNIAVYPTIGNHESHPANVFSPFDVIDKEVSSEWLYELLANLWSAWLPASTKDTIMKGGYYTVSPRPGFRVIALNNNECSDRNWWIFYDVYFLSEQLEWLRDTLLQAEKDGEHVHILSHYPTGDEGCISVWSHEFHRIVERFSKTISGIFNGHTHTDELSVYYFNATIPINIAWNGGSLTTFTNTNPNYKLYQVEPSTFQVVDQDVWYYNLTAANLNPNENPKWELEYKMTEAFDLKDLSPASIDGLLTRFAEDPSLLRKYWTYFVVQGDPCLANGCSANCLKEFLCNLAKSDNTQMERCNELKVKLQEALDKEGTGGYASSITALKITTLLAVYFGLKFFI